MEKGQQHCASHIPHTKSSRKHDTIHWTWKANPVLEICGLRKNKVRRRSWPFKQNKSTAAYKHNRLKFAWQTIVNNCGLAVPCERPHLLTTAAPCEHSPLLPNTTDWILLWQLSTIADWPFRVNVHNCSQLPFPVNVHSCLQIQMLQGATSLHVLAYATISTSKQIPFASQLLHDFACSLHVWNKSNVNNVLINLVTQISNSQIHFAFQNMETCKNCLATSDGSV